MHIDRVLEACVYAADLDAAEEFYTQVLGLERYSNVPGRHVFFRVRDGMFLIFNPERTRGEPSVVGGAIVPTHGATGPGHVAFAIPDAEIPAWRRRIESAGIVIDSEVNWPRGGRSLYFRDPAGNCIELASPKLWGLSDPAIDAR